MHNDASIAKQARFFLPLTITAFLTLLTHSLFNAGLARLPSPEVYIAAFAVAKSLMHMFESPIMMVRQTVAALVDSGHNFTRVRNFMLVVVASVVVVFAGIVHSGLGRWIVDNVMGLQGEAASASIVILSVFVFFPFAATLRNFMQGILIKFQTTPLLTVATIIRIVYVTAFIAAIPHLTGIFSPGIVAGLMFFSAISVEAVVLAIGAKLVSGSIEGRFRDMASSVRSAASSPLSYRLVFGFFGPLIITAFIKTLAMPIINIGLARTIQPEIAISAYAVAWALGMIVLSPTIMFHQVPLNFIDDRKPANARNVRNFAFGLAVILSGALAVMSFTDIGYLVLTRLIGASDLISRMSMDVLRIMVVLPFLMVTREFYWGLSMKRRVTKYLSKGKIVNVIALTSAVSIMVLIGPDNPAVVGIVGMCTAEGAEALYLFASTRRYESAQQPAAGHAKAAFRGSES